MSILQTHIKPINFIIKLNYYNWFDSYTPNHFNLINKLLLVLGPKITIILILIILKF